MIALSNASRDDSILYELIVYSEWQQDPELTRSDSRPPSPSQSVLQRILSIFYERLTLTEIIAEQIGSGIPWQFAAGEGGKVVAILQDTVLEIRSSRDDYTAIVGKAIVPRDPWPQWRRLMWSPDCSLLAIANSNGFVHFYDLLGCNVFTIQPDCKQITGSLCADTTHALASILFLQNRITGHKWSSEVLLIDYHGNLRSFLVSPTDNYCFNHKFSFASHYRGGVSCVVGHSSLPFILVGGRGNPGLGRSDLNECGSSVGLTAWRFLNDVPFYKLVLGTDEEKAIQHKRWGTWRNTERSVIFKMEIATSGKYVACLQTCGAISIWQLPSLRLSNMWQLTDQPDYDIINPISSEKNIYKGNLTKMSPNAPIDINWWSDAAIILSRFNGTVSVNSVTELRNLLGESPEFFSGQPQITRLFSDRGFLILDCESVMTQAKKRRDSESDSDVEENDESPDDKEETEANKLIINSVLGILKNALFLITDMERFRPEAPKMHLLTRTFRMLGLNSTTPEELYSRKIDNGQYAEALTLATLYNLDSDLVYQRQWRNAKVSNESIAEYLSKISKRWWVLDQCIQRVPESLFAARELLLFGLRACSLSVFKDMGTGEIINIPLVEQFEDPLEDLDITIDHEIELLKDINVEESTADQKKLLRYRLLLLKYLDRLSTYEIILGTNSTYLSSDYDKFRSVGVLHSAVNWARNGDWNALNVILLYYAKTTSDHWLPLLSNLPETLFPSDYITILPECDTDGSVILWRNQALRQNDWCEEELFRPVLDSTTAFEDEEPDWLYAQQPELLQFFGPPDDNKLSQWYIQRARDIESRTGLVDHALTLISLGKDKGIKGLDVLHSDLNTLDCMIYEVNVTNITLNDLEQSSDLQQAKWLMQKSSEATFVNDLIHILLPFIKRQLTKVSKLGKDNKMHHSVLEDYLVDLSETDLSKTLKYFQYLHESTLPNAASSVLMISDDEIINLAMRCIYANKSGNLEQIILSQLILESLPEKMSVAQKQKILDLKNELNCCCLLINRGMFCTPLLLKEYRNSTEKATEMLYALAKSVAKMYPPPSETEWNDLLEDLIKIHDSVFSCVNIELVFEIYVSMLLSCANKVCIRSAGDVMECRENKGTVRKRSNDYKMEASTAKQSSINSKESGGKIPYSRSVQLVLEAAREYFDSARSFDDPNMELAKTCLSLIKDRNDEIQEELDLIAALRILQDSHVSVLPLQVRLCPDRLQLIEACLANTVTRSSGSLFSSNVNFHTQGTGNKILHLAKLLRVCGGNESERDGAVLEMLAKNTIETCSWDLCYMYCCRLMSGNHGCAWRVLSEFSRQAKLLSSVRLEVLAYALLHCDIDAMEELLDIRCDVEMEQIKMELNRITYDEICDSDTNFSLAESGNEIDSNFEKEDDFVDAVTSPTTSIKEMSIKEIPILIPKLLNILSSSETIKDSTLQFLSHLRDTAFGKKTDTEIPEGETISGNQGPLTRASYPAFYSSLHKQCMETDIYATYDSRFSNGDEGSRVLTMCHLLLRFAAIEQRNSSRHENKGDLDEVLLQYAQHMMPHDLTLGLGILLSLKDPYEARHTLGSLPVTKVVLQISIYYASLQICIKNIIEKREMVETNDDLFAMNPNEVLQLALSLSEEDTDPMRGLLDRYMSRLGDLCQADELQSLGCGVDTHRFTLDEEYRRDSILGLAMSPEEDRYNLALKLGARHGVHMWNIALEHVSSLLQSPDVPISKLLERLENADILKLLKEDPVEVCNRLTKYVFPTLDGTQHTMLIHYYTLIHNINSDFVNHGLTAMEHCKLLKKVKASCPDLEYSLLLDPPHDFVSAILPSVSQNSLAMLSKLLKNLPPPLAEHCQVSQSKLYSEWAKKHLFELPIHSTPRDYTSRWISLKHFLYQMSPEDLKSLVYHTTLSHLALSRIDIETRAQLLREAIGFCNERMKDNREDWFELVEQLTDWLKLLDSLCGDAWQDLLSYGEQINYIVRQIQDSCTTPSILMPALQNLLRFIEIPLEEVTQAVKQLPNAPSISAVLDNMLKEACKDLSSPEAVATLSTVISRIEENQTLKAIKNSDPDFGLGDWNNDSDWIDEIADNIGPADKGALEPVDLTPLADSLLPLFGEPRLTPALRLRVMEVLKELNVEPIGDSNSFLYQHTQATVLSTWIGDDCLAKEETENLLTKILSASDISTEDGRVQLFSCLLNIAETLQQLYCLKDLLVHWPVFENNRQQDSPWLMLLEKIILRADIENCAQLATVLGEILGNGHLNDTTLLDLLSRLGSAISTEAVLLVCLLSDSKEATTTPGKSLLSYAVDLVKHYPEQLEEPILALLLSRGLLPQLTDTRIYQTLLELALAAPIPTDLTSPHHINAHLRTLKSVKIPTTGEISRQLQEAGLTAEAGALGLASVGTPRALKTFNAALSWARRLGKIDNDE